MELKKRQVVVVVLVLMIIAAGYLNYNYKKNSPQSDLFSNKQNGKIGNPVYVENNILHEAEQIVQVNTSNNDLLTVKDDYFARVRLDKQNNREQEVDKLQEIVNNSKTSLQEKDRANSNINKIIMSSDNEMVIENLLIAKGFEDCVVLISGDNVNVVVKSKGLSQQEVAQILDAVRNQTKAEFSNIHIIERK